MTVQKMKRKRRWERDLAKIIEVSDRAIEALEKRFAKKSVEAGPLYVLLGESHEISAHALAQIRIMHILQQRGYKISAGLELGYDERDFYIQDLDRKPGKEAFAAYAPLTSRTTLRFLMHRNISTIFNDAAVIFKSKEEYLDNKDEPTRRVIIDVESKAMSKNKIAVESTVGIKVRNHFMVALMKEHADKDKPDFFFQLCGAYHVAGVKKYFPYSESMMGILRRDDKPVLGISFAYTSIKKKAMSHSAKGVAFMGDLFFATKPEKEQAWLDFAMPQLFQDENYHLQQPKPAPMSIKR